MERILGHLHTLDDPARLRAWIDTVRTDPTHRHGLTVTQIRELPGIRVQTLAQFPDRDGTLPRSGPLRVTRCIQPPTDGCTHLHPLCLLLWWYAPP